MLVKLLGLLSVLLCSIASLAQAPEVVVDNPQVRVLRYQLQIGQTLQIAAATTDRAVVLAPGVRSAARNTSAQERSDGQQPVVFLKKGLSLEVHAADAPSPVFVVDFRKAWEADVRLCDGAHCSRTIKVGGLIVGETRSLLSNGFVSAYRHSLKPAASLASSYYTQDGTDNIVMIAFSELRATFDADDVKLNAGQAFYSSARDVEVNADKSPASWVVLRIQVKRATK